MNLKERWSVLKRPAMSLTVWSSVLGTGSTAYYMIEELGRRVKEENLSIVGVPTSWASKTKAESLGIPVKTIDEVASVDLTIDGADEISGDYHGIKGGGAALLLKKSSQPTLKSSLDC